MVAVIISSLNRPDRLGEYLKQDVPPCLCLSNQEISAIAVEAKL